MAAFEPNNPDYRAVAALLFDGQPAMRRLGISLVQLAPGEAELPACGFLGCHCRRGALYAGG
jgi:hypothetical protein